MKRSLSLRTRVAVAAFLAAGLVVALIGIVAGIALARNDTQQLDRRLDVLVDAVQATTRHGDTTFVLTVRDAKSGGLVIFRGVELPRLPLGTENVTVGGVTYRVRTIESPEEQTVLSLGTRADAVLVNHRGIPVFIAVGVLSMLLAGGFAWLFAGRAVRPLHQLTDQTRQLDTDGLHVAAVRGARESEELADAMAAMLGRVSAAQSETTKSLLAARDFAASAAHELRTPLTAMRADLDTLRAHDLSNEERTEVIGDLQRAQRRVEATITALGQLASGDLARPEDRELVDIADLLDRVAADASMHRADMPEITVNSDDGGVVLGWPDGLRLAVDNLVRNAINHGNAKHVVLAANRADSRLVIEVDDDGTGLPESDRERVLGRFERGPGAKPGGLGLGLALVAQQAALHGGDVVLSESPLGGLRATLTILAE
ncbi:putative sensor-type histidine kinase PrrB [Mycolicibacterium phlei]|uniref:sensor histidine kinase n=1 Tax=Mycobacteroides chelonae TaxID=1774 RepID=UPI000618C365|nr:HAMP domain-containing sensor histidine kinase [Mycobacteroides chelonae]VEG16144.1 putative sensor-type histidine kinase PrrB [Mycolicibacterium phlei]AKC38749.1 ATPase [Mycobacteroides chelonae]ANA98018.1 ATPase [Mycobacteroides chelonae CCUG 47445]OLT78027.1 two-component sensor histidine kinase [Mycobacteroides chelonae]ORV14966.1 ATPase [Mycobacteroides chelonae]